MLKEDASGITFLDLTIQPDVFAKAITGSRNQLCTVALRDLHNLGKRREVKEIIVPYVRIPGELRTEDSAKAQALAPFEVDGWKGRPSDLGNYYRGSPGGQSYCVTFTRFVEAATDQEEEE